MKMRRERLAGTVAAAIVAGACFTNAAAQTVIDINSELETVLKGKGIQSVVALGTQAQTSVLHTGAAAALREFKVIVPVDGMSSDDVFPELYTAWHLAAAARISARVTLTKLDRIGY